MLCPQAHTHVTHVDLPSDPDDSTMPPPLQPMPATTKKFTPEIDAALYDELVTVSKQNGQSQRYVLEQALSFYLHNVVPSQHLVRPDVMSAFEQSVAANRELLERLAK